jgi:hypothetical protein
MGLELQGTAPTTLLLFQRTFPKGKSRMSSDADLVSLSQASRLIPNRPTASTVHRWVIKGIHGGHKLRSVRIGGRIYTKPEWIEEFLAVQNPTEAATAKLIADGC